MIDFTVETPIDRPTAEVFATWQTNTLTQQCATLKRVLEERAPLERASA